MKSQTDKLTLTTSDIEGLPGFKKKSEKEYSSACPFCGEGEDRFLFWPEVGNYYCRRCDAKGFVSEVSTMQFDPALYEQWKQKEADRKANERRAKLSQLDRLNEQNNASRYHHQLTAESRDWWHYKGLSDHSIDRWQLGYTTSCPTLPGAESYTIPITYQNRLYNIRHRLANAENGNKYRPEMAGLPLSMFNADILLDSSGFVREVVLVEGEIKAMVLQQQGFDTVGIPGAQTFKDKWVRLFDFKKLVYIALDPGADEQAVKIWLALSRAGITARLCSFPVKPDDFFVVYGGTPVEFYQFLTTGRA